MMMRLAALASLATSAQATTCDLFDADPATKCVAAHSTVRALYKSYAGALYQVRSLNPHAEKAERSELFRI